jgi:tRNA dimethylallyltransferase
VKVIVLSGPTASGKTNLSLDLALKFGGEIVNFDSLLLYKEINIGTAKPNQEEQSLVPHHMLNVRSIKDPMNAAQYASEALPLVNKLLAEKKTVYLVGGSGFYLQALIKGMYDSPTTPEKFIKQSNELYELKGIPPFREILLNHDKASFDRYHENDHYRIRRAVEHWWSHGTPLFEARLKKEDANNKLIKTNIHGWDLFHIYLNLPKEEHLQIIEKRTSYMIQDGLIEEVKSLLQSGFSGNEKPLQAIGYKETFEYLSGKISSQEELTERIVISTRQLAKSQRTWFNRDHLKKEFHPLVQRSEIFKQVDEFLNN